MPETQLHFVRIKKRYLSLVGEGYIGGVTDLYALSRMCWDGLDLVSGSRSSVCLMLAFMFGALADYQEGDAPTADLSRMTFEALHTRLLQCLDVLISSDENVDIMSVINGLAEGFSAVRRLR